MWLGCLASDDSVRAAQVHEGKEAEQAIVVCVEISILVWFVLGLPKRIDKLLALGVAAHDGG